MSSDRFPALGGIARIVAKRLGSEYYAGIWAIHLKRGLLWEPDSNTAIQRSDLYIAPSWSWAAIDGKIRIARDVQSS